MNSSLFILAIVSLIGLSLIFGRKAPGILLGIAAFIGAFGLFYTILTA
jgi:hypothetical protein